MHIKFVKGRVYSLPFGSSSRSSIAVMHSCRLPPVDECTTKEVRMSTREYQGGD